MIREEYEQVSPPERRFRRTDDKTKRQPGTRGAPPPKAVLAALPTHEPDT